MFAVAAAERNCFPISASPAVLELGPEAWRGGEAGRDPNAEQPRRQHDVPG